MARSSPGPEEATSALPAVEGARGAGGGLYSAKVPNFMWRIWVRSMLSLNFLLFPMTRLRDGTLGRASAPAPCVVLPPPGPLSITFRFRMMRFRLGSRGFTLRLMMRTVSEKGEMGGRRPGLPPCGSGRGKGRRDMRWQRRMSFLSRCTAALECSLGEEALALGLTEKCTSLMRRASAWARACGQRGVGGTSRLTAILDSPKPDSPEFHQHIFRRLLRTNSDLRSLRQEKKGGGAAQMVECLPNMHGALGSPA